jgi:hypothetical protein
MATSVRGRTGSRTRTTSGTSSAFAGRSGKTNWGRTSTTRGRTYTKKSGNVGPTTNVPTAWKRCNNEFSNKITSYKTLYNQTRGPAKHGRPTPTTLTTFANWINKGGVIHTVTATQVARWAKATKTNFKTRTATPTACRNVLCKKFGKTNIKAVARTKSGSFMVVTPAQVQGKWFCFPK